MQIVDEGAQPPALVDLLEQLPRWHGEIREYCKGRVIYEPDSTEDLRIHLVQEGLVITKSLTSTGKAVGLEILGQEEVFGLEALVGPYTTLACCAKYTQTLSWGVGLLDQLQRLNPLLSLGLAQTAIRRCRYFQRRIEEFASMPIQERLATFLIEKAQESGSNVGEDGGITLFPITHEVLGQFIGTSREIVTYHMNLFRRAGYVTFNRKQIRVFNASFAEWVENHDENLHA